VAALIDEAKHGHASALLAAPPLTTLIKLAVPKPRPRRPASKASAKPSSGGPAKRR